MNVYKTHWCIADFVRNFIRERHYAPTIEEIRKGLGISSTSVVKFHLKALMEDGIIGRQPDTTREMNVSEVSRRGRVVPLLETVAACYAGDQVASLRWGTIMMIARAILQ